MIWRCGAWSRPSPFPSGLPDGSGRAAASEFTGSSRGQGLSEAFLLPSIVLTASPLWLPTPAGIAAGIVLHLVCFSFCERWLPFEKTTPSVVATRPPSPTIPKPIKQPLGERPSSPPEAAGYFEISVKRQGLMSGALHASVRPASMISVMPPAGGFSYPSGDGRPLALLAGGVGITPLMSKLRHAVLSNPTPNG